MDATWFDHLTVALTRRGDRRRAVRAVLAALAGAPVAWTAAGAAAGQAAAGCFTTGKRCKHARQCCSGRCVKGACAPCRKGTTECGHACVDTRTDPKNCGRCGRRCAEGHTCDGGVCACGGARCSGCCDGRSCVPVNQQSDASCGRDGAACVACANGKTCQNGECHCLGNQVDCGGTCCGANECCAGGTMCVAAGASCGSGEVCCGGACTAGTACCDDDGDCATCQVCQGGACVAVVDGTACGTQSEPGGGTIRCCNGACPDPDCLPYGDVGIACSRIADCDALNLNCCAQRGATCVGPPPTRCSCRAALRAGDPCASDNECQFIRPSSVCVCGRCTERGRVGAVGAAASRRGRESKDELWMRRRSTTWR